MKYLTIFTLLFLFSIPAQAEIYFELGIGIDPYAKGALPEVDLQGPLGKFVIGAEAKNGWSVEFEHISSIPDAEVGNAVNVIWATKRIYF